MKREFPILSDDRPIGTATVTEDGLYFDIACKCTTQTGILRVIANCSDHQENIGICVPKDGQMVIRTKIPKKKLQSLTGFSAVTKKEEIWIPIVDGKPIPHLDKILYARYSVQNGKPGLFIPWAKLHKDP